MQIFLIFLAGFFFLPCDIEAQCRLEVEITGFRNNQGGLLIQLMDENQNVVFQNQFSVNNYQCHVDFENLSPGKYGVRFYHDENLSGKMETNLFGKPIEGYGFSNNAFAAFGPPDFKKWLIHLTENKKILLKVRY
jgi:uncharacterized protein (DUF2141 family)